MEEKYSEFSHTFTDKWADDEEITCAYQFRKPNKSEVNRLTKEAQKSSGAANHNLLITLVHPDDKARMLADLENYPGLAVTFANGLLKASGFGDLGN